MIPSKEKTEAEWLHEYNKTEGERRKKICFPIRNLGLVLFDLVPAEKRESLIDGIRQMIRGPELPEIPRGLGGTLGGGWRVNIGPLKESKALASFEWIEGSIGQDFDFCYFLTFRCILRPDLRNT